jgi:hypothetical protein
MIKGRMTHKRTGKPILFLGITAETVERMKDGNPVWVDPEELSGHGLPEVGVFIHYGETEQAIVDEFADAGVHTGWAPEVMTEGNGDGVGTD